MSLSIPTQISFSKTLSPQNPLFLSTLSQLSLNPTPFPRTRTVIRMGGGPRTYPGGVSKWQWKRMQAKKAKQLLKARLCRERQIYEMRKRAELKAAVSELERPWEVVEKAPNLFSVNADEQLKVLADRFQKPGGFDMWSERDGPQLFQTPDGVPSARFFPRGVVHSVRPYGKIIGNKTEDSYLESENEKRFDKGLRRIGQVKTGSPENPGLLALDSCSDSEIGYTDNSARRWGLDKETRRKNETMDLLSVEDGSDSESGKWGMKKKTRRRNDCKLKKHDNRNRLKSGLSSADSGQVSLDRKQRGSHYSKVSRKKMDNWVNRKDSPQNPRFSNSGVFDMSLQQDGSYGFQTKR